MIIYKVKNKINNKEYIGQTVNSLEKRMSVHKASTERKDTYFTKALKKYGFENFEWIVLEECSSKKELDEMEFHYIKQYNTLKPNGYNLTLGGEGNLGWNPDEKTRKKIGIGRKKAWDEVDEDYRRKWGEISKKRMLNDNPMKGKERLDIKGKNNPAKRLEVRKKISEFAKNRNRLDLMGENNPAKRLEVKKKISEKLKGRKAPWMMKYMYHILSPFNEFFETTNLKKIIGKYNELNYSGIQYHIKNNTDNYKGWRFIRNEIK